MKPILRPNILISMRVLNKRWYYILKKNNLQVRHLKQRKITNYKINKHSNLKELLIKNNSKKRIKIDVINYKIKQKQI